MSICKETVPTTGAVSSAVSAGRPEWRKGKRISAKQKRAMLAGVVVAQAAGLEEGKYVALERRGDEVILRVRLVGVEPAGWLSLNHAFKDGYPWVMVDKSGITRELREAALRGKGLVSGDKIRLLDSLPKDVELPDGIKWTDFTERQLKALLLMSDITSDRSRAQIAALVGTDQATMDQWEGREKFLKVKRLLLERTSHRLREQLFKNMGTGMKEIDGDLKLAWSKLVADILGYSGRSAKAAAPDKSRNPLLDSEVKDDLDQMGPDEREALVHELKLTASLLAKTGTVIAETDGKLTARKESNDE